MNDLRIAEVTFTDTDVVLTLANGGVVTTPLVRYIRVEKATPAERTRWMHADDGHGVNWPELWEPDDEGMVSIWDILQDRLYEAALGRVQQAGWDVDALSQRDHELVALWRLEADINNGGFLQFFGNWGVRNHLTAVAALDLIGACRAAELVRRMHAVIEPYADEVVSPADLPGLLTESDHDRLQELDEAFWEYPDRLARLVVQHYDAHTHDDGTRRSHGGAQ
ncbi:DMP19 family protein [Rhodococcus tukisamuensis]|uniref:DNA mimic protein DMP19 C-terminal domain-containing protein n=1 Tax=Rhodococcus tukisamuensis TaxID=168276 RepID=A0A1G6X9H5_9NOCA|nr:DUF4375 domain-containing protein [Rhodococcus tukisamuensis]SDD73935.1 protein of unknown function [Rhodococcus tukisamuensis]